MRNRYTVVVQRDGKWFTAFCPEVPGANGQGRTKAQCRKSLSEAIHLILEDRRKDAAQGLPEDAIQETLTVR